MILREGLQTMPQQHLDEKRCLPPDEEAIFFCPTFDLARCWGAVVVRFPWPADAQEDDYGDSLLISNCWTYSNWYTQQSIPASDLEEVK